MNTIFKIILLTSHWSYFCQCQAVLETMIYPIFSDQFGIVHPFKKDNVYFVVKTALGADTKIEHLMAEIFFETFHTHSHPCVML